MRFSTSVVLAALPLLTAAAENPFDQYMAQFQNFLGQFGAKPAAAPSAAEDPVEAVEPAVGAKTIHTLTLENWNETLYGPVQPGATEPEEWWVLISGRNKTCFGRCLEIEAAFNETALKFAALPKSPHMGYVNCDDEQILCNSWSSSSGVLWVFEMLPPPAPIDIYRKRLNHTTTTSQTLLDLYNSNSKDEFILHDGYFHPYNGPVAQYGLSVPLGYFFHFFNMVPSWAMMLVISFASRTMMGRRTGPAGGAGAGAGAGAPRAAPPGDARS